MTDEQVAGWQRRLDRVFPWGLVAAWEDNRRVAYLVPRVVVTSMSGSDPVVWLLVFAGSDKVLGPLTLTSFERLSYKVARVRFGGVPRFMTWSAAVSRAASRAMNPDRQRLIALAPEGGEAVMHELAAGTAPAGTLS